MTISSTCSVIGTIGCASFEAERLRRESRLHHFVAVAEAGANINLTDLLVPDFCSLISFIEWVSIA